MSSDVEKQIAFEMAKAIVSEREKYSASHLEQVDKVITPEYWSSLYNQCLEKIKQKPEPNSKIFD